MNVTVAPQRGRAQKIAYGFRDASGQHNGSVISNTNHRDATRSQAFSYHSLNRINTAATSSASASYSEDFRGNLHSISLTGSPAWQNGVRLGILTNNRIIGHGHGAADNMTSDGLYHYAYDAEQRPSSAAAVKYNYHADRKRVGAGAGLRL